MKVVKCLATVAAIVLFWGSAAAATINTNSKFLAKQTVHRCAQWFDTAVEAGWETWQLPKLDYIMWRESRCFAGAINKTLNADKSWDYGLLQINDKSWCKKTKWYPMGYLQSLNVLDYCVDLLEPHTNLKAAKALYDYSQKTTKNGFNPWGL